MRRMGTVFAATAVLLSVAGVCPAQTNGSRQVIPFMLEGPAAELAAKMLFICGGGSGGTATGPVRFTVTVKHAVPGETVTVSVGGVPQASAPANLAGAARFVFGANGAAGLPLDFDPRRNEVEVEDEVGTVLTNTAPDGGNPEGTRINERVPLLSTGAIPGASGGARLRERRGVRDFDVEIEDVPDGVYTLLVDAVDRGVITAAGGRGKIEFSDGGDDPDEIPLDFDPFGAAVQVAQGSTIVLSGTMLAGAIDVSVCTPTESTTLLANVGPDPDAHGDARFRVKDDCDRDFRVEIEDLPIGAYDVLVGGVVRGTIDVADLGLGETAGQVEFDTDVDEPGEIPLDFDPGGQTVEVRQGATLFLSTTVGTPGPGTCDVIDLEPAMINTGADADAHGKARFRQEIDCDRDLRVEVDDLAVGTYELVVGGIVRGAIDVVDVGAGDTEGSIDFDNDPDQPGEILLDFDPRGETLDVRQGASVFLTVTLPS